MAFREYAGQKQGVELLQRSLERGRLAHAYLFAGDHLGELETLARALAKTLNCAAPLRSPAGAPIDSCETCLNCRKIDHDNHPDVFWVRPESKLRQIRISQIARRDDSPSRVLLDVVNLKPTESRYKIGIVAAADRLNEQAANAFLKTLEEPPPSSLLILLSTEPQRMLETILSRCLRLDFGDARGRPLDPACLEWLGAFAQLAGAPQKSLLGRYRLLDALVRQFAALKANIEQDLRARSPLERYDEAEPELRDQWEAELAAAIEAEYRRQRADLLAAVHWWLRDVWLLTLKARDTTDDAIAAPAPGGAQNAGGPARGRPLAGHGPGPDAPPRAAPALLRLPEWPATALVAARISSHHAAENLQVIEQLQRRLGTNVQEALALEVALLKLNL